VRGFSAFRCGYSANSALMLFEVLLGTPKAALEAKSRPIYDFESNQLWVTDVHCSGQHLHLTCVLQQ